jgi:hypothetical protein
MQRRCEFFSKPKCHELWLVCIRDSAGVFVAAGTHSSRPFVTIVEGESMAILVAMREAVSRGWSNVVYESHSKVVDTVLKNHQGNSEWSSIILSIKSLL